MSGDSINPEVKRVLEKFYGRMDRMLVQEMEQIKLPEGYTLVGFELGLLVEESAAGDSFCFSNEPPSFKKQKSGIPYAQFKDSLFAIVDENQFMTRIMQADSVGILEGYLNSGEVASDFFSPSELRGELDDEFFKPDKNYAGFYLCKLNDVEAVLVVYRKKPEAILVNTMYSASFDAEDILSWF